MVNQYYCYCVDEDFGFFEVLQLLLFNVKLCINGNEWVKRQVQGGMASLDG